MWSRLRALWDEPRPARPTKAAKWDRTLVFVLLPLTLVEVLTRGGLADRPDVVAVALVSVGALWFRSTHPLLATGIALGFASLVGLVAQVAGLANLDAYASASVLLLPYSLLRWGSGREAIIGLGFVVTAYAASAATGELLTATDAIGAAVVMLFPAALGASVRYRATANERAVEHARMREREQLARELHDTVAHHITAIAIQAQAGRALLSSRPDIAARSLAAIEDEAKRTLVELREIVGVLRAHAPAELAPQPRIADLERLARSGAGSLPVHVDLDGDLDDLRPSVETTIYRLAQEAVTNALRHARRASHVRVRVVGDAGAVRLMVHDDGEGPGSGHAAGFGLVGMAERAALLGGTFSAGPGPDGGWRVVATIPRGAGGR